MLRSWGNSSSLMWSPWNILFLLNINRSTIVICRWNLDGLAFKIIHRITQLLFDNNWKKWKKTDRTKFCWNVALCSEPHIWLTAFSVLAQFSELCFYLLNICKFSPRFECLLKIWSTSCLVLPCSNQLVH